MQYIFQHLCLQLQLIVPGKLHSGFRTMIQWNLSVTTTSIIKFITCDLFSSVF